MRKPKKKKAVEKTKRAKKTPRKKKKAGFNLPHLFVVERVLEDTVGIKGLLCLIPGESVAPKPGEEVTPRDTFIFVQNPVFSQVAKFDTIRDAEDCLIDLMPDETTAKVVPLKKHYEHSYDASGSKLTASIEYKGTAANPTVKSALRTVRAMFIEDITCVVLAMRDNVRNYKRDCKLLQKDLSRCNKALAKFDKAAKQYA